MPVDDLDADLFDAVEFGDREYAEVLLDRPDVNEHDWNQQACWLH
jgi:hypothetical protein